jgi:beta-galactosidase
VNAEDPTRLSTYASHHRPEDTKNFHTDVLGFNKYFGWYGAGQAEDIAKWADDVHRRFPTLHFSMSEYGAGANIRQHDLSGKKPTPGGEWHPEEYQAHFHEVQWRALQARDFIWGKFIWNLFDFAADQRSEGAAPGLNDKGLVTYDRKTRKDAFYWYQANWSDAPVLYLAGRRYSPRPVGKTEITVYANAPAVELWLNGRSCGVVASTERVFRWAVELVAGENQVVARVKIGGAERSDAVTLIGAAEEKK